MLNRPYKILGRARQARKYFFLVLALLLALLKTGSLGASQAHPHRILSFDLCIDQMLLEIVPPEKISALTFLSRDPAYSTVAGKAEKFQVTNGSVEDAFKYKTDLILVSSFEKKAKIHLLQKMGFSVHTIAPARSLITLRENISKIGSLTGHVKEAEEMIDRLNADMARVSRRFDQKKMEKPRAIYLAANRHTQGENSVVGTLFKIAGYHNIALEAGLHQGGFIGLETLIASKPDIIMVAGQSGEGASLAAQKLSHPGMVYLEKRVQHIDIPQKYILCLTPKIIQAVNILHRAKKGERR